ncbi:O-methyltransferase [Chitinophaga pinensis]|uniref:O-methyltransferase family 3 n=1 Tax=Chitinophaga pinensis (strain ATCC 43595 / DSM 2588 / LMG 13176 / NBRC 15968 / NCIMB 11800 / UQM 2034) TaxID=485918 RepID=A0A979G2I7_CHIPD|nr:class I SAM-dependent methyltransferase [Chitinophaga pinensis]ACU59491.1 O-methyltransferase family 3 [Chitinophaga pinensis DSM 2588]
MTQDILQQYPDHYQYIVDATNASGFTMASDPLTCSLLRSLAAAKPYGSFLELGTGTGLSTSWILDGMDKESTLISVDNAQEYLDIAIRFLNDDSRIKLVNADGGEWLKENRRRKFDFIFADTWHGKYLMLDETLAMLNKGGLYIIDDMLPQSNWPEGHQEKATQLIKDLEAREDLVLTKQVWASGIIIGVKK